MHDCCQVLDALWLIVKRTSSGIHVEQCAKSIMLAKVHWSTARLLHSFSCYDITANLDNRQHLLLNRSSSAALCVPMSVTHDHDADKPWQAGRQAGSRTLGQQQDGSRNRLIEVAKVTAP